MTDIKINTFGDVDSSFSLVSSAQELIKQKVLIKLRTNLDEWKFNLDFGMPWVVTDFISSQVFTKGGKGISDNIFREAVLSVEGVENIIELNSTLDEKTREYSLYIKAKIFDGSIIELSEKL